MASRSVCESTASQGGTASQDGTTCSSGLYQAVQALSSGQAISPPYRSWILNKAEEFQGARKAACSMARTA